MTTATSLSPHLGNHFYTAHENADLEDVMNLAHEINAYVQEQVPIILNYLERCKIDYAAESEKVGFDVDMHYFHSLASILFELAFTPVFTRDLTPENIQKIAAVAKKFGLGTCFEMSLVGLDYCLEKNTFHLVEPFYLEGGSHVLLVLGRVEKSQPEDYKGWGPTAVVCDTWKNTVYPAKDIEKKLMNFVEIKRVNGHMKTILEPFDPKKHKLALLQ